MWMAFEARSFENSVEYLSPVCRSVLQVGMLRPEWRIVQRQQSFRQLILNRNGDVGIGFLRVQVNRVAGSCLDNFVVANRHGVTDTQAG